MRRWIIALVAVFSVGVAFGDDNSVRTFDREFAIAPGSELQVALKVGELRVETADVDSVLVEVEARCRAGSEPKCFQRLEKLGAELTVTGSQSAVSITGVSKRYHRMDVEVRVVVPKSSPLSVTMYAGELSVAGDGQDLEVRLKYGDVTVHQPLASTQSVLADANFGDAQIYAPLGDADSRRPWLVGSRVTWDEGEGDARVTVNLSAGDATVHLD